MCLVSLVCILGHFRYDLSDTISLAADRVADFEDGYLHIMHCISLYIYFYSAAFRDVFINL